MKKNNLHTNKGGFKIPENYFETFEKNLFEKISLEDDEISLLPDKVSLGLKEPDGYFDAFENRLMKKLNVEDNQNSFNISDNINTGFAVPEKYFENVEEAILQKKVNPNQDTKVISLFSQKNVIYLSGIAAMIAIIISISINNKNHSFSFDTIDIADIQEYFEEGNVDLTNAELASLLTEETSLLNTFGEQEISNEELEFYLYNEEIAEEIIYVE
ncbi:hypothetical protein ACWGOQ_0010370 [Aquimarina sp. M1]